MLRRVVPPVLALALATWQAPAVAVPLQLSCGTLRAQIFDGIPGTARLLGESTGGCPDGASAAHSNFEADAEASLELSSETLRHHHRVEMLASATTRISITEAFLSFSLPAAVGEAELVPVFNVDPLRHSAVLQLTNNTDGSQLLLVAGFPILAGESSTWDRSDGTIESSVLQLEAGSSYQVYSRLTSYNQVDNALELSFATVPEPPLALVAIAGLLLLGVRRGAGAPLPQLSAGRARM